MFLSVAITLFHLSVVKTDLFVVHKLLIQEGFTPLHVAASLGHQDFVLYLLNEHANVDCIDAHGRLVSWHCWCQIFLLVRKFFYICVIPAFSRNRKTQFVVTWQQNFF